MSEHKCNCGKHNKGHAKDMNKEELNVHVKDCMKSIIKQMECLLESIDNNLK